MDVDVDGDGDGDVDGDADGDADADEAYGAYGAYVYGPVDSQRLRQTIYSHDGLDGYWRDCPFVDDGPDWAACTEWVWVDLRDLMGG